MSEYLIWRAIKFLGLVLLSGGVFGTAFGVAADHRMRSLGLASLGLVVTWSAGYMMMHFTGMQLTEPWIVAAVGASLASLFCSAHLAHARSDRLRRSSASAATAGIVAAALVMVVHSAEPWVSGVLIALSLAVMIPILFLALPANVALHAPEPRASWNWFKWIARVEGLTLILLMLVNLPLKKLAGMSLDGGTGLPGWIHGTMFFLYVQGLWNTGNALGWSWLQRAAGFVLSLIPFGKFVFEYHAAPRRQCALNVTAGMRRY